MGKKELEQNNVEVFSTRDVLLSTGELTREAVIIYDGKEFYESAPFGLTLGLNETQSRNYISNDKLTLLNELDICKTSQKVFDEILIKNFDSQTSTAFSLAFLKLLSYLKKYDESKLFKYLSENEKLNISKPKIISNILNGSKHANNKLEFCEFMIIPHGLSIEDDIKIVSEVYLDLENVILEKLGSEHLYVGREGGFSPMLSNIYEAIELMALAIYKRNKDKCSIAIDVAANNFCQIENGEFVYTLQNKAYTTSQLVKYYIDLVNRFPQITYLEDPFHELDITGWKSVFAELSNLMIVADDITISKINNIKKYEKCFNACILKINQAGCFTELLDSLRFCNENDIKTIISQRSGETDSSILPHLAVGLGADYMKSGAPARERIVKYNELLRISKNINIL